MPFVIKKNTRWFIELRKPLNLDELDEAVHEVKLLAKKDEIEPTLVTVVVEEGTEQSVITAYVTTVPSR